MAYRAHGEVQSDGEDSEQRSCARGQWCASRTVAIEGNERIVTPALGSRAFCDHDEDLIGSCLDELPGIYHRLHAEIGHPAATETSVHVPFGPSVPLRMDIEAAMRTTARLLHLWEYRVRVTSRLAVHHPVTSEERLLASPGYSTLIADPASVADAAKTLEKNLGVLLAFQPGDMPQNIPLPAGKLGHGARGIEATCRHCGRRISWSPGLRKWWGAYATSAQKWRGAYAAMVDCTHEPRDGTIVQPSLALIPAAIEDEHGDTEIIRFGADFLGLFIQRDGAAAGLEILHLHYWNRAVLRETQPRPEELLGIECRSCSLLTLRRAEPPWHKGDPEFYSECAECGALMTEDGYRGWTGQLYAYHKARIAAMPLLTATPAP